LSRSISSSWNGAVAGMIARFAGIGLIPQSAAVRLQL
jgi:hypothetical protein